MRRCHVVGLLVSLLALPSLARSAEAAYRDILKAGGADVDLYRRLAEHVPASETLWRVGEAMLRRIRDQKRIPESLRLPNAVFASSRAFMV